MHRAFEYIYYKLGLNYCFSWFDRFFKKPLKIMDAKETIDYIIEKQCSICRFGDGELQMMVYGWDTGFQKASSELRKRLQETLMDTNDRLLVGLANRINKRSPRAFKQIPSQWQKLMKYGLHDWLRMIPKNRVYGDANISRLTDEDLFGSKEAQIEYTKKIWDNREVITIEGKGTFFGVGNGLLDNAKSCARIIGPEREAFGKYEIILNAALKLAKEKDHPLILLALGPTATVMAKDICQHGFQAVDIGHLDLVYEKERHHLKQNDPVPGRYSNEAFQGDKFIGDQYEPCKDEVYLSQIHITV